MIYRSIQAVNRALLAVSSVGVLLLAAFVFAGVISRYVFDSPLRIGTSATQYLLLAVVFLGLSGALQSGAHVRIDFVTDAMPPRVALVFRQVGDLVGIITSGVLTWLSYGQFSKVLASGETDTSILLIPLWMLQWVLVVGFGFLTLTGLLLWVRAWRSGIDHHSEIQQPTVGDAP